MGGGVTVTDLVYLPSFWEIHNWDTYGSGPSKPVSNENAENSAWLSYYSPAGNPSSWSIFGGDEQAAKAIRTKKAAGTTTNESWWLASARAGYQGGYFNSIESTGNTYYWGQEENLGIIPVFCVK